MNEKEDLDELSDRLDEVIDDFAGRLSASAAIGVLELVKLDLWSRIQKVPADNWIDE